PTVQEKGGLQGRVDAIQPVEIQVPLDVVSPVEVSNNGRTVTMEVSKPVTSNNPKDVVKSTKVTLTFGSSEQDKLHTLTDNEGNKINVHNPQLDWSMVSGDRDDNKNRSDHATGWTTDGNAYFTWKGADDAADVIIAPEDVITDPDRAKESELGYIGSEGTSTTNSPSFNLNTGAGGRDLIIASTIGGNVSIDTNEGDDLIQTVIFNGKDWIGNAYANGSQIIDMGTGNDHLLLTGTAADRGLSSNIVKDTDVSLYYTNAKINMGDGDDIITMAGGIVSGNEDDSGNYFNLGNGNDSMTVNGKVDGENTYTAANSTTLINLGHGDDTLDVKGQFGAYGGSLPGMQEISTLIVSEDSSNITLGSVVSRASLMLGDGRDNVTIKGEVDLDVQSSNAWNNRFVMTKETAQRNKRFDGYYDAEVIKSINNKLAAANKMVGNASLGDGKLSDQKDAAHFITRFYMGNGDNSLTIGGVTKKLNYVGGNDSDTVNINNNTENSKFWMGKGDNRLTIGGNANNVNFSATDGSNSTIHVRGSVDGGSYTFGGNGATNEMRVNGSVNGSTSFHMGKGSDTTNKLYINNEANMNIFAGNGNDRIEIGHHFYAPDNERREINLGDGDNYMKIHGVARNVNITTGSGNDEVEVLFGNLATFNPQGSETGGFNQVIGLNNTFTLGDGNDTIRLATIEKPSNVNSDIATIHIYAGNGNDTIVVGKNTMTEVKLYGENGNDTIQLGNMRGDNTNIVDGGAGIDKLILEPTQSGSKYYLGNNDGRWWTRGRMRVQNVEEVVFNNKKAGTGVDLKVSWKSLTDLSKGIVKIHLGEDVGSNTAGNKVDLDGNWTKQSTKVEDGITYNVYLSKYPNQGADDQLWIDNRIII
ncbi:hypothetical protein ACLRAA_06180, partial [Gallibacterium anatis]